jgi:plastocyanin
MKRILVLSVVVAGLGLTVGASASPTSTLLIRHQVRGCHSWSFNGGAYKPAQAFRLAKGSTLVVTDNDVMPHKLVQLAGPKVAVTGKLLMSHMGASVKLTFPKAGVYRFTTRPGEDYMSGMKTIGEDNVLHATITVS